MRISGLCDIINPILSNLKSTRDKFVGLNLLFWIGVWIYSVVHHSFAYFYSSYVFLRFCIMYSLSSVKGRKQIKARNIVSMKICFHATSAQNKRRRENEFMKLCSKNDWNLAFSKINSPDFGIWCLKSNCVKYLIFILFGINSLALIRLIWSEILFRCPWYGWCLYALMY